MQLHQLRKAGPLAGMLAGVNIGAISLYVMPLLASAMMSAYGVNDAFIGYAMAIQLGGLALASFVISRLFTRIRRRTSVGFLAVICIVSGNFVSAAISDPAHLLACRALVGFGEGIAFGLINGIAARDASAHKIFSWLTASKSGFACILFSVTPVVVAAVGGRGAFFVHGLAVLALCPLLFLLPRAPQVIEAGERAHGKLGPREYILLIGWGSLQVSINSVWTFTGRIAEQAGVSASSLSIALIISSVLTMLVPLVIGFYGTRSGLMKPLLLAAVLQILKCILIAHVATPAMYYVLLLSGAVTLYMVYPYISTLAASLDNTGRLAAALPGAHALGSAIGPAIAGALLTVTNEVSFVGYMAAIAAVIFAVAVVPLAMRQDELSLQPDAQAIRATP